MEHTSPAHDLTNTMSELTYGRAEATLAAQQVTKWYGMAPVLSDVTVALEAGKIHAVIGENGAGKSTLAKILGGAVSPDRGWVAVDGHRVRFASTRDALRSGVAIILQEPMLFPDLSVAENMYLGRQPRRVRLPLVDRGAMKEQATEWLTLVGALVAPDRPVFGLSVAEMQLVEIATALSLKTRILIVDEPTASLTPPEVGRLFGLLRNLCARGVGVMFIGHRLEEVLSIADSVSVLRDGRLVAAGDAGQFSEGELIRLMVGRAVQTPVARQHATNRGPVALEVRALGRRGVFANVTFRVSNGEIVGMAGLVGAGRSEIARAIFGIDRPDSGEVLVDGTVLRPGSVSAALAQQVGYVPEDRKAEGLASPLSVGDNVALLLGKSVSKWGFVRRSVEQRFVRQMVADQDIRTRGPSQPVGELSGGNQQKVVLARWLAAKPKVLILDEPTRGVDVGAKAQIHNLIRQLAGDGLAILVISSDLPEILALADRILVVRDGLLAGELPGGSPAEVVLALAVGGDR